MTAQSTRERSVTPRDASGDRTSRHRAPGGTVAEDRSSARNRLTVLAVVPWTGAALVGLAAAAVLAHSLRTAHPLSGKATAALWLLAALFVALLPVGVALARRAARELRDATPGGYPVAAPGVPAAPPPAPPAPDPDKGVFVHLSHRLQSLVHRQIELLDALENDVEEPDLLKGLFSVDHLATRMRRHAENLAVLGGAVPRRQWTRPVSVMEVLRSSVSETLDYARVQVIARATGSLNGHAVADVIHLLAELVENATAFSPPDTKVVLRAHAVAAGLAVEIDDRGLGMDRAEYDRINALLREPADISVQQLLEGARIGLYVVAQLARRHAIAVQLQSNITGGTQALVVLPRSLLAAEPRALEQSQRERALPPSAPAAPNPAPPAGIRESVSVPADQRQSPRPGGRSYSVDEAFPAPRRPAARESVPAAAQAPAAVAPGLDSRPLLPRRRPQEHLAGPLQEGSLGADDRVGEGLTPNLMADFRRGLTHGTAAPGPGATLADHPFTQEGER